MPGKHKGLLYNVRIVPVTTKGGTPAVARDRLVAWYRERAAIRVPERVAEWSARLGLRPPSVLIREPQKRWGSADARGNIRFNWRIIQTSTRLIDYVVAHELVHLAHPDDTRDFWATRPGDAGLRDPPGSAAAAWAAGGVVT